MYTLSKTQNKKLSWLISYQNVSELNCLLTFTDTLYNSISMNPHTFTPVSLWPQPFCYWSTDFHHSLLPLTHHLESLHQTNYVTYMPSLLKCSDMHFVYKNITSLVFPRTILWTQPQNPLSLATVHHLAQHPHWCFATSDLTNTILHFTTPLHFTNWYFILPWFSVRFGLLCWPIACYVQDAPLVDLIPKKAESCSVPPFTGSEVLYRSRDRYCRALF